MTEVADRKKIALNYLQGWFFIDLLSIIPFQLFFTSAAASSTNSGRIKAIAKVARIGRLYKLIRMIRLAKLFRLLKVKNTVFT